MGVILPSTKEHNNNMLGQNWLFKAKGIWKNGTS